MIDPGRAGARHAERLIGRLLIGITYLAVLLLLVGVALLIGAGVSPLAGGPRLDVGRLVADLLALQPTGFLWLGLLAVIAAPITRVTIAMLAYARDGDWLMVGVSAGILVVIAIAVVSAVVATV
ncbi:MAG: hypothetical protein QOJ75_901 [Chloroflexota bacterium]|jgi:uncharacterized membrane protein|nr:hypothetical protein [Chloroflexota bacterium]